MGSPDCTDLYNFSSRNWNEHDDDFDHYLDKLVVEKVSSGEPEPVTIELRSYIED